MTKKLILLGVVLIALGIGVISNSQILKGKWLSSNATDASPTIQIGSRELIMSSFDSNGPTYDMSSPTLRHPTQRDKFYTWWVNATSFKQFLGTLNAPFQTQTAGYSYSNNWDSNGFPKEPRLNEISFIHRPWMANVYKHTDGTLIGFVHVETDQYDRPDPNDPTKRIINDYARYRQGISISTDGGTNWKYLGDVIRPQRKDGYSNLGGTPLLIVPVEENGQKVPYFYQYFNEVPLVGPRIPAVARARVADVVAAAKLGNVSPWTKYNRNTGGWANESGMDGLASNITWNIDNETGLNATNPTYPDRYDLHTDAVYSTALGKYILLAWEQAGYDYSPPSISTDPEVNRLNKGIYLYTSTDGVNWGERIKVYTPLLTNEENPYMFFAGGLNHPDTTDDMNIIGGNEFYIYFPDRKNHKFYRIPVTINNGVVTPPKKIMPLGDSITQANGPVTGHPGFPGGYRKKLGELLTSSGINYDFVGSSTVNPATGIDPDHNGYPGFRTDEILSRLPNWLTTSDPDIVLLHIGTNDLLQHKSTSSAINNLRQIVRNIVSTPGRELYIAKIIPILDSWENLPDHPEYNTPEYWKPIVDGYNQAIINMLGEDEFKNNNRIHIVDMTGQVTDPSTGETCAIMLCEPFDGLHPAQKGLNRMGILWYNAITGSTPPVVTPPIPVITSPTVDQVFPSNTSTINLEWNTVSEASGYHLRVIEYTDATKTTQTTRRYAGNTNSSSPFYVYIDNYMDISLSSLSVDPGRHYRFWIHSVIDGVVSDGKEVFFSVNSGSVVIPKVLSVNVVGQGTITSTPAGINCGSDCTESYSADETIMLNAAVATGYTFSGWSGACSGISACSISMTENRTVTATFTPITYTLTTSVVGQGNITGNSSPYTIGATATITANPTTGYTFTSWSGNCTGTNPICTLTMNSDKNTTATFTAIPTTRVCKPWN